MNFNHMKMKYIFSYYAYKIVNIIIFIIKFTQIIKNM